MTAAVRSPRWVRSTIWSAALTAALALTLLAVLASNRPRAALSASTVLFSDGFESGDFSHWTSVSGLIVQQQQVRTGLYAARGTSAGTPTYATEQLSSAQDEILYDLHFKPISLSTSVNLLKIR